MTISTYATGNNPTRQNVINYTYDYANRLTHMVNSTGDVSYTYNGQGNRISKTSAGQAINY